MSGTMSGPDEQREHEATEIAELPDPFAPDDMDDNEGEPCAVSLHLSKDILTMVDPATGEVLGIHGAPDPLTVNAQSIAAWLGPCRLRLSAKADGIQAERARLHKEIDDYYVPLINEQAAALRWLDTQYLPVLERFTRQVLSAARGKAKSVKEGLLTMGYRQHPASVAVVDVPTAIEYLRGACPEAVKVMESVLVSRIPKALWAEIEGTENANGLCVVPAEDRFYCKGGASNG